MRRVGFLAMTAVVAGTLAPGRVASAQRVADFVRAGAHVAPAVAAGRDSVARRAALRRLGGDVARAAADSARARPPRPHLVWPWYVLGGAAVGAGTGTVLAVRGCPPASGCRDDGGLAWTPVVAGVFALGGAALGGVVGGLVDYSRRHPTARAPSGP